MYEGRAVDTLVKLLFSLTDWTENIPSGELINEIIAAFCGTQV
jgi:hypothetical protein